VNGSKLPDRPLSPDTLVSVVLPVYNEAEVLPVLLGGVRETLSDVGVHFEIVFVNDGSTDRSPQVLDRLAAEDARVRVVHFSRNFGHQAAVQAGLAHARGDAVVLMDSDMQDAPEAIPRFLEAWQAGSDVVYAVRTRRKEIWPKRLLFAAFHRLMASVASVEMPVDAGNFGLVDRRVVRQIVALGETDRYFPGLRSWVGFRQRGVEVERHSRYDDRPRVSLCGLFRLAKTAIFSFSSFPLRIFQLIGILAALLFLGLGGFSVFCKVFTDYAIPGWASQILAASFFGAINALGIWVLGEYIIRIYDQVRGRPLYVVDRTVNMETETPTGLEEGSPDDAPYRELVEEAMRLLESATAAEQLEVAAAFHKSRSEPGDRTTPKHNSGAISEPQY